MSGIFGLLVALLWSVVCFRTVSRTIDKAYFKNAPRLANSLTSGLAVTVAIIVLALIVSFGTQFALSLIHFIWPVLSIEGAVNTVILMTIYAVLKALVCGLLAGLGMLHSKDSGKATAFIALGLGCWPVFIFVPLACGG